MIEGLFLISFVSAATCIYETRFEDNDYQEYEISSLVSAREDSIVGAGNWALNITRVSGGGWSLNFTEANANTPIPHDTNITVQFLAYFETTVSGRHTGLHFYDEGSSTSMYGKFDSGGFYNNAGCDSWAAFCTGCISLATWHNITVTITPLGTKTLVAWVNGVRGNEISWETCTTANDFSLFNWNFESNGQTNYIDNLAVWLGNGDEPNPCGIDTTPPYFTNDTTNNSEPYVDDDNNLSIKIHSDVGIAGYIFSDYNEISGKWQNDSFVATEGVSDFIQYPDSDPLNLNPAVLLHFNEISGITAYDSSGNNRDGTLRNGASFNTTAGLWGSALQLDGINDDVIIDNFPLGNDFTIMFWTKAYGSGYREWVRFKDSSGEGVEIRYNNPNNNDVRVQIMDDGGVPDCDLIYNFDDLKNGSNHHIAAGKHGSDSWLAINSEIVDVSLGCAVQLDYNPDSVSMFVGSDNGAYGFVQGQKEDFMVIPQYVNQSALRKIYLGQYSISPTSYDASVIKTMPNQTYYNYTWFAKDISNQWNQSDEYYLKINYTIPPAPPPDDNLTNVSAIFLEKGTIRIENIDNYVFLKNV